MRRRLIAVALAVTSMVVLAFVVPLGMLVRDLAADRALTAAEREAEGVARFIAVLGVDQAVAAAAGSEFELSVVLPDGTVVGAPVPSAEDLEPARAGTAFRAGVDGGQAVYVPVLQPDGVTVVVRVFVADEILTEGVTGSWVTLGLLGMTLIGIAVGISDRLARSVVAPVRQLQETAVALGDGDLAARVDPAGPEEIREVGMEFNRLAEQIGHLLQQERETAADLSHRLRTPLTAMRLDAEALPPGEQRDQLIEDLDELERHVDFVITEARRESRSVVAAPSDISSIAGGRVAFWSALADEQDRDVIVHIAAGPLPVPVPEQDAVAMIDAIIGNVFAHTAEGTGFEVVVRSDDGMVVLRVDDSGPGFPDEPVLERGRGHGTGLGLDIARRTAEGAGGALIVGRSRRGGASVVATLPLLT